MPVSDLAPFILRWLFFAAPLVLPAAHGRSPQRLPVQLDVVKRSLVRSEQDRAAKALESESAASFLESESFGEIDRVNLRQMLDEALRQVQATADDQSALANTQEMLDEFVEDIADHPSGRSLLPWLRGLGSEGLVQLVQTSHELGNQDQKICKAASSVYEDSSQAGEYVRPPPGDARYAASKAALPDGPAAFPPAAASGPPRADDGFILLEKDASESPRSVPKMPTNLEGKRPKFTLSDASDASRDLRGKWGEFGQEYAAMHPYWMKQHPNYVTDEKDADVIFAVVHPLMPYTRSLARIPARKDNKKWVIWGYSLHEMRFDSCLPGRVFDNTVNCTEVWEVLDRKDLFYLLYDLRDPFVSDNARSPLPGVTVVPPMQMSQIDHAKVADLNKPTKYHLTVRCNLADIGWYNSSHVREHLGTQFKHNTDPRIVVEDSHAQMACLSQTDHHRYSDLMMNTSFALCPHGDQRWSYRFTEALKSCAIPVVMADGMTMPLEEVIDWKQAAIQIPESYASDKQKMLDALPKDQETINRMRKRVCEIWDQYLADPLKQFDASLLAIGKKLQI